MPAIPADLAARVDAWLAADPDPVTRLELERLRDEGDVAELADRFDGRLAFGTAGLRGTMAAGPRRMNRVVVRQSAAGIARHLLDAVPDARDAGVVVTFDGRHNSAVFARDCAEVVAAHGIPVRLGQGPLPTPVGVFAVRHGGHSAGMVVTASHNPPRDNGLKLYMGDGAQIVPPVDGRVAAEIAAVAADGATVPDGRPAPVEPLAAAVVDDYVRAALGVVPPPAAPVRIALTAMHGVGGALGLRLLEAAGHADVHPVPEQIAPDPDFPTVGFPNPEEPGATDLLAARMTAVGAALGLALDPDADRVAVLVPDGGGVRPLTGDEVGALLAEWLLAEVTSGPGRLVTTSVVSSGITARIAAAHGARHAVTLTGFKWLSRPAMDDPGLTQVLAYEEAIGYAVGPDTRDKDGLTAALAVASMTSALAARGRTPLDLLDDLHLAHGVHLTDNFSLRDEAPGGQERRARLVTALAAAPPPRLGARRVLAAEALAPDVLRLEAADGVRVVVRPSGTEPKLKCYCEVRVPVADRAGLGDARARGRAVLAEVRAALGPLLTG